MARWTKHDQHRVSRVKENAADQGMRDTDAAEHAARKVAQERGKRAATTASANPSGRRPLEHRTVEELQLLARQRKIPGRSRMNRAELIEALETEGTR